MRVYHKCILIAFLITIFLGFNTLFCFAKTYEWDDFTKPFNVTISGIYMGRSSDVEVYLPDSIKDYEKIFLIITASRDDFSRSVDYFTMNDQSDWTAYNIHVTTGRKTTMRVEIKAEHLKAGPNVLHFKSQATSAQYGYEIYELCFDIRDMKIIKDSNAEKTSLQENTDANNLKHNQNGHDSESEPIRDDIEAFNEAKKLDSSFDKTTRKYLQHALQHLGYYDGKVDGAFGPQTRRAIKAYQRDQGETPTGYLKQERAETLVAIGKSASNKIRTKNKKIQSEKHSMAVKEKTAQTHKASTAKNAAAEINKNETKNTIEKDFIFLVDGYHNPQHRNPKKYSWYSRSEDIQMGESTAYCKPPRSYQRMCNSDAAYFDKYLSKEEFSVYSMDSEIDIYFFKNQLFGIDFKLDYSPEHYRNVSWGQESIPGRLLKEIINRFGPGEESDKGDYELHWNTGEVNVFIMKGQGTCNYVFASRHNQLSKEISALADKRKKEKIAGRKKFDEKAEADSKQAL